MTMQVLLKNRKPDRINDFKSYRKDGGYTALSRVLKDDTPMTVRQKIEAADLRGRGGAGFPAGKKWITVPDDAPHPRYLIANTDEMEPGTFKDRVLLHAEPHALIEGMAIAGYAVSASKGFIFIRPSYDGLARILEREIGLARDAGFLGENIAGSGYSFEIEVHRSGGRYICGEATALINAIMGKRPNPFRPPPYPTVKGLWERPTVVNNTETLAFVPYIIRNGAEWFRNLAVTETGAGTKLFAISGKVRKPGCYELPMGTRLSEIIETHAGGMVEGGRFKACLPGGASTRYLTPEHYDIEMDFDALSRIGHRLGTAAIIVFDHRTCLVAATVNLLQFFVRESCGWCTPCREGLPYILELLTRIERGEGKEAYIPQIRSMTNHLNLAYCAFAPGAGSPVESLLTFFEDEVREHIRRGACPFRG